MDGISFEKEFEKATFSLLSTLHSLPKNAPGEKERFSKSENLAPDETHFSHHEWLADDSLLSLVDLAKQSPDYFKKLYDARTRFLFLEKTQVEFVYSTCLRCGRKYVVDTSLASDGSELGKIEFFSQECFMCTDF
jgi:hypothetical protein